MTNLDSLMIFIVFLMVLAILIIVSVWKVYTKAGKEGWSAIIPIYNAIVLLEIIKKPIWWAILMFIPIVNIIFVIIVSYFLAQSFGKGIGFTLGLIVLPFIFYPILAFGKSKYLLQDSVFDQGMGMQEMAPMPAVEEHIEPTQFATPEAQTTPENPQL